MTTDIFHDFPGLENSFLKFHDFPGCAGTLWKSGKIDPECHIQIQTSPQIQSTFPSPSPAVLKNLISSTAQKNPTLWPRHHNDATEVCTIERVSMKEDLVAVDRDADWSCTDCISSQLQQPPVSEDETSALRRRRRQHHPLEYCLTMTNPTCTHKLHITY